MKLKCVYEKSMKCVAIKINACTIAHETVHSNGDLNVRCSDLRVALLAEERGCE